MQVKKQQLELDMDKPTGSKQGKEYVKAAYCHPVYLTYMACCDSWGRKESDTTERLNWTETEYIMQNAGLDEAQAGIKIARRNINNLR